MTSGLPEFNLITQPWVRVRMLTDELREMSLFEVFRDARHIRRLAGEMPSQDAAVLRLLLAIVLGATRPDYPRSDHECLDLWHQWTQSGGLPTEVIADYLDSYGDRFELFHVATPFMQVADLHTSSGRASGLSKIISEVPAGSQYFTTRAGRHVESLSFGEAARWLVHCQQFDPAGIKTGAVGDARVQGGKGYSFGYPAWAGNLGVVLAEGENLDWTLRLNLPLSHANPDDRPIWERLPLTAAADSSHPIPTGPADAFTWQSRRIRLFPQNGQVVDVQISNGDKLPPQNLHPFEPMTTWRFSKNQSKAGQQVLMPVTHDSAKLIWQGLAAMLAPNEAESATSQPAAAVTWLGSLVAEGEIDPNARVSLRAIGIEYGSNNSVIDAVVDDALIAPAVALVDPVLRQTAIDAAGRAFQGVLALVRLGRNLATAAGSRRDDKQQEAIEQRAFELGYSALDGPYRRWLSGLNDAEHAVSALESWGAQVREILRGLGQEMVNAAGPDAWQGREITVKAKGKPDRSIRMDSARANLYFLAALNQAAGVRTENIQEEA